MMLDFFDQFVSPTLVHIPLVLVALMAPGTFVLPPTPRWDNSRLASVLAWFMNRFTLVLFDPIHLGGHKWAVLLTSLMLFLISLNMLSILPYTFTPTAQLSLSLGLAVPLWLATVIIGLRDQPTITLAHLLPLGAPVLLIPILIIIETISHLIRPMALGVRLAANLTAGHLLVQLIATGALALVPYMPATAIMAVIMLYLLAVLEVAVAMIQAYVFVLLLSLYLQENV